MTIQEQIDEYMGSQPDKKLTVYLNLETKSEP